MKQRYLLLLFAISLVACNEQPPMIYTNMIDGYPQGSFESLEDESGTWSAEENNASIFEIDQNTANKALQLLGGKGKSATYTFSEQVIGVKHIGFNYYNISRQDSSFLSLEKYSDGQWSTLHNESMEPNRRRRTMSKFIVNNGPIEKIRFTGKSSEENGIIIDDIEFISDAAMMVENVETHSPVYPVLIGKDNNPIHRININATGIDNASEVNKFNISLGGTVELNDIASARIFFNSNKENYTEENLFGEIAEISQSLTIEGSQELNHGSNYFWLTIELKESTDILDKVSGTITGLVINHKTISVSNAGDEKLHRLGHALRQHDDEGVDTYRIPGLATTNNGTLISVYDIRRNSGVDLQEDVDIGMNRSTDRGQSWEPMKVIMDMGEWGGLPEDQNGIGDPAVLVDRVNNTIWVAAVWAHGHPGERNWWASKQGMKPVETSQFVLVKSEDDGKTWSPPINITSQIKDPKWHLLLQGPGKGITLKDGTLVFPAQFKDAEEMPHSTIIYSKDRGVSWHIGTGAKSNTTEAQVVELDNGTLMLNMRDNRGNSSQGRTGTGSRSVATTNDLGKTWNEHPTSRKALIEPVCMASLIKHQLDQAGNSIMMFSNPADQFVRQNMTIKISEDEGNTWPEKHFTLIDEGRGRGYSCMTSIDKNTIGILYEGSQSDLIFQKFLLSELMGN